jgi:catechol 2,3-dioxygenase-like lactoylglutathione lyase family enzyme
MKQNEWRLEPRGLVESVPIMPLGKSKIVAFVPTKKAAAARKFYERALGLRLIHDDPFALVFDAGGRMLRVVKVAEFTPAAFTIVGWEVGDIEAMVKKLSKKRVRFQRYQGMEQDRLGIWASPGGARVAWFKDPDGNVLSISQH